MTISTTTSAVTYQGNNSTTLWTFPFVADQASDLQVYVTVNGVASLLSANQYAVTINTVPVGGLWGIGGTVTYPLAGSPLQVSQYISIIRAVPYEQNVSINNQGAFYPQAVEQALDIIELQIQQIETGLGYTLRTPETDILPPNVLPSAALRANGYLAFDANGQPIIVTGPTVIPTPGTFATPRRVGTSGTATINVLTTDSFSGVSVYQSGASATTVQLPATAGPFPIFDGAGNAGTYPIIVLPPSGKTINGQSQFILAFNYQSATFYNDGLTILIG